MKKRLNKVVDRSLLHQEEEAAVEEKETIKEEIPAGKPQKRTHGKLILISIVIVVLLLLSAYKIYVDNNYKPLHSMDAYQAMTAFEIESSDNALAIQNMKAIAEKKAVGFIIYGEEKVQRECYLPLMTALAENGYCAYLPTTFGNLPVLNREGAEHVMRTYRSVHTWYIIAHGKACPVAARYARSNSSKIKGLIYLGGASYHTDLSYLDLSLLSIQGSRDSILDQTRAEKAKENDPVGSEYISVPDGNHSGILDTILMRGDTPSPLSNEEQINETVAAITAFISNLESSK